MEEKSKLHQFIYMTNMLTTMAVMILFSFIALFGFYFSGSRFNYKVLLFYLLIPIIYYGSSYNITFAILLSIIIILGIFLFIYKQKIKLTIYHLLAYISILVFSGLSTYIGSSSTLLILFSLFFIIATGGKWLLTKNIE